ncbi:MAG: hypothetical protein LLG37_00720 [Spirochaetia bacterium]|nr:hypothetical protein [Spirochaetia bacterium]
MSVVNLYPKKPDLSFYHKNSEVSYDPTNKYYQATFDFSFEKEIYDLIESFIAMALSDERPGDFGALPQDRRMTNFYFDVLADFNSAPWDKFNAWYFDKKQKVLTSVKSIILNSIMQQKELKVDELEFFTWAALTSLISGMAEDYFQKHFETLKIMRDTLALRLGEAFEIILTEVFRDEELDRLRTEKTGQDKRRIEPLISRYVLMYPDAADMSNVERVIFSRDRYFFIDRQVFNRLLDMFEQVLGASKRLKKHDSLRNILPDMASIKLILADKRDRKNFTKLVQRDREFKRRMVMKYEQGILRRVIREILAETGSCDLVNFVKHDSVLAESLEDHKVRNYLVKQLKTIGSKKSKDLARYAGVAMERVNRSVRSFGGISPKEMEKIMGATLENFSACMRVMNNFLYVRQKYGKKSAYSEEMLGIKVMRQSVLTPVNNPETGMERMECLQIGADQKTRIENLFEEGNLFYVRGQGQIYAGSEGGLRGKKIFMFTDLRNSTETTMKLTKDTAGFLTPYLNTVYKTSVANGGTEIYFAGDGFAAHYANVTDCIRAAYLTHKDFVGLRKEAEEKIKKKEKELFKEAVRLGAVTTDMKPGRIGPVDPKLAEDIKEMLVHLSNPGEMEVEDIIHMVAGNYSMPRVEMGIGITLGELFFAVIGEENNIRFNIVLSPSLTQAARLSGSNAEVKAYLEKLYGMKNMPRKACAYEHKLFNQGIVITQDVFNALRAEVEVETLEGRELNLSYNVYIYYDRSLDRNMALSKLEMPIALKGIEHDIEVFEVFSPAAQVDQYINNYLKGLGKQGKS